MTEAEKLVINEETKRKFYWRQFVKLVRERETEMLTIPGASWRDEDIVVTTGIAFNEIVRELKLEDQ